MAKTASEKSERRPYQKSAIQKIYRNDEAFVLIGLTGRTGSGCSTVAKILGSEQENIRHSLFSGACPSNNAERKERIVHAFFQQKWTPFHLIQVRSIITTFILDKPIKDALESYGEIIGDPNVTTKFGAHLKRMQKLYNLSKRDESSEAYVEYFTRSLPSQCEDLRKIIGESAFVRLYQVLGENIRLSGDPYNNQLVDDRFFSLAERIDAVIGNIRRYCQKMGKDACIVIDAIRSPLEAIYFQDRYSAFYLMAVSCPEDDRLKRLRTQKYTEEAIRKLDEVEYPKNPKKVQDPEYYSVQDIQACLQRADLYVSNPNDAAAVTKYQGLANQLIRFICLIRRPGLITPTAVERSMQIAYTAKLNSGCISRQVGALVTDANYSVKSLGWNDAPYGQVPCNLRNRSDLLEGRDVEAYSDFEKSDGEFLAHFKKSSTRFIKVVEEGRNNAFCFKTEYNDLKKDRNQVHTRSLHAEENAFLQLAKYGSSGLQGGMLFTTASPCELCSKKAYQLGIRTIYYIDPYPGIALDHILKGGAFNPTLVLFSGAIGRAFHRLYTPIVAYKDELYALTS